MNDATGSVQITHYDNNDTWIIALAGEHDLATSPHITARTLGVWPHCSVAIVDLSAATFVDSSVVNWLVRARSTLEAQGSSNAIRIVEDPQRNAVNLVFDALRVRDEFACYATIQDAVAQASTTRLVRSSAPSHVRLEAYEIPKSPNAPLAALTTNGLGSEVGAPLTITPRGGAGVSIPRLGVVHG